MLEKRPRRCLDMHLYQPLWSRLISVKFRKPSGVCWTGGSESSFCQIGAALGLASTSHFKDTGIPSRMGIPKPGSLEMAKDGVSATKKRKLQLRLGRKLLQCGVGQLDLIFCRKSPQCMAVIYVATRKSGSARSATTFSIFNDKRSPHKEVHAESSKRNGLHYLPNAIHQDQ